MRGASQQVPQLLVFSSGNPAATVLAAGLLHDQTDHFGTIVIQGIEDAVPPAEVVRVHAEIGIDLQGWSPLVRPTAAATPVAIGLTICVPT